MPVTGKPAGGRKPCDGAGTACEGTCDGKVAASCTYPSAATACGKCSAAKVPYCDGKGTCGAPKECQGQRACAGDVCAEKCAKDDDCIAGYKCAADTGNCVPKGNKCSDDRTMSFDAAGASTACSPVLCDPTTGLCGSVCKSRADCTSGLDCREGGKCLPLVEEPPDDRGCGCAVPGQATGSVGAAGLAALALLGGLGRRRRR
jgi:MYXO-CTERM domain-containing protein